MDLQIQKSLFSSTQTFTTVVNTYIEESKILVGQNSDLSFNWASRKRPRYLLL